MRQLDARDVAKGPRVDNGQLAAIGEPVGHVQLRTKSCLSKVSSPSTRSSTVRVASFGSPQIGDICVRRDLTVSPGTRQAL